MMFTKKSIGFLAVTIMATVGIGFLSFEFISSSAQTAESNSEVILEFDFDNGITQQDCVDIGGTVVPNYEIDTYECIRG